MFWGFLGLGLGEKGGGNGNGNGNGRGVGGMVGTGWLGYLIQTLRNGLHCTRTCIHFFLKKKLKLSEVSSSKAVKRDAGCCS